MSPEDWSQLREVQISPEDLINSGWREVVAASDKQDYFSLHKALHDASVIAWQSEQRNRARSLPGDFARKDHGARGRRMLAQKAAC